MKLHLIKPANLIQAGYLIGTVAIFRPSGDGTNRRVHVALIAGTTIRPLCGGGNGTRSVTAWQTDNFGIKAVNCKACVRHMAYV